MTINLDKHICKAKDLNTGEWVYGYPVRLDYMTNELFLVGPEFITLRVDQNTICRCTEVPDKHGKILFEHDIVKMRSYGGGYHESVIYFKDGKFAVDGSNYGYKDICSKSVEFVRNRFDNTELMEK